MDLTAEDFGAALPIRGRLLGFDLGTKTIGMALSDVERRIASPLETLRRTKFGADAQRVLAAIEKFEIVGLVLGLPLNMDGSEGPRVQATRAFARNLGPLARLPLVYWDERLSTAAVTRDLIASDVSRAKRSDVVDKMAAAYILQGVLDRLDHLSRAAVRTMLPVSPGP